jgi:predicted secreted protein
LKSDPTTGYSWQLSKPPGNKLISSINSYFKTKKGTGYSRELIYEELVNNNWGRLLVNLALKEARK